MESPAIRLRPYRPSDWSSFLSLEIETIAGSISPDELDIEALRIRWPTVLRERYGWVDSGPTAHASEVVVLETEDGQYGGHVWVADHEDLLSGRMRCWIVTIAVVADHRGLGWGRALMQAAIALARARGRDSVGLSVSRSNLPAWKLYERIGFREQRSTLILHL